MGRTTATLGYSFIYLFICIYSSSIKHPPNPLRHQIISNHMTLHPHYSPLFHSSFSHTFTSPSSPSLLSIPLLLIPILSSHSLSSPSLSSHSLYSPLPFREHAMVAICNGMFAYGGFRPFCATFLNFIGYALGSVRCVLNRRIQSAYLTSLNRSNRA